MVSASPHCQGVERQEENKVFAKTEAERMGLIQSIPFDIWRMAYEYYWHINQCLCIYYSRLSFPSMLNYYTSFTDMRPSEIKPTPVFLPNPEAVSANASEPEYFKIEVDKGYYEKVYSNKSFI